MDEPSASFVKSSATRVSAKGIRSRVSLADYGKERTTDIQPPSRHRNDFFHRRWRM